MRSNSLLIFISFSVPLASDYYGTSKLTPAAVTENGIPLSTVLRGMTKAKLIVDVG